MNIVIQSLECLLLKIEYKQALTMLFYSVHIKLVHFTNMNVHALELCEHFCKGVMSNKLMFQTFISHLSEVIIIQITLISSDILNKHVG